MARLWHCGFELNSLASNIEVTSASGGGTSTGTIVTSPVRSGTYAYRTENTTASPTSGNRFCSYTFSSSDIDGPFFFRCYFRVAAFPVSAATHLTYFANAAGTSKGMIRLTTAGELFLANGSQTQIGSRTAPIGLNTWYRLEFKFFNSTSSGFLEMEARYAVEDGPATVIATTTTATTTGSVSKILFGSLNTSTGYDIYFDDVALNDSTGSVENSYPTPGKIIHLRPNAAGDNTGLTDGVTDNVNHYLNVDEASPDGDTTYNQSALASQIDDYNIDNSGLSAKDTVTVVSVGINFRKVTSGTMTFVVRVKASSGGTVEESASISSASTTYQSNSTGTPKNYPITLYSLPSSSTPWTASDLNSAQLGVRTVSNTANNWRFTAIWALVEYRPASVNADKMLAVFD